MSHTPFLFRVSRAVRKVPGNGCPAALQESSHTEEACTLGPQQGLQKLPIEKGGQILGSSHRSLEDFYTETQVFSKSPICRTKVCAQMQVGWTSHYLLCPGSFRCVQLLYDQSKTHGGAGPAHTHSRDSLHWAALASWGSGKHLQGRALEAGEQRALLSLSLSTGLASGRHSGIAHRFGDEGY